MYEINYHQIGVIHSPFKEPKGTPIQPTGAIGIKGKVEVFHEFAKGLKDIEGFSHIILIYHFHLANEPKLLIEPFMDNQRHGVFATRASSRPNAIGISTVRLTKVDGNILYIQDVEIVDDTPLLDIKPYVPEFDIRKVTQVGWLERNVHKLVNSKDDERFVK